MSVQVQFRRGTTAEHATFTGAPGEITVDTDKDVAVVHDGATAGGFPSASAADLASHAADTTSIHGITDTSTIILSSGSYSNPSWITALAWSKITTTPTTLAGYGITDAQPLDADLTSIAALGSAANKGLYTTALHTWAEFDLTSAGRDLLDDATAADQRTTLGLGTLATQNGTFSGTSSGTNTGDQTITLTGDVTGTGTGSFAATIANDAVTFAKIQNITDARLLGRSAGSSGDTQEITIGAGLTLSAGALGRPALTGDVTASADSNSLTIANDAVTFAKMLNATAGSKIIGSTAAGDFSELTISTGLTLSGSNLQVSYGTTSGTAAQGNDSRLISGPDGNRHIWEAAPGLGYSTGFKAASANTAFWVYLGRFPTAITIKFIRSLLTVNAAGLTSMSVCVASGSDAPNGGNITMTLIAGTASFDDLTTGAPKLVANSSALNASVPANTDVYIGMNANYSTLPTFIGLIRDNGLGRLLSTAAAGSLASGGPWTAVPIAFVADATLQAPRMYATDF